MCEGEWVSGVEGVNENNSLIRSTAFTLTLFWCLLSLLVDEKDRARDLCIQVPAQCVLSFFFFLKSEGNKWSRQICPSHTTLKRMDNRKEKRIRI